MSVWVTVLLFLVGLALIVKGGDWFLDGAVWIAEATGVPRFIIGATVVSLATTLPELTVSATGVMKGEVDLAVGNAVGSVTANLGLILGISIVCIPAVVSKKQFNLKAVLMALAAGLLLVLCRGGVLPVAPSLLLFVIFALYLWNNIQDARTSMADHREHHGKHRVSRRQMALKLFLFAIGIPNIGRGTARDVAGHFGALAGVMNATQEELLEIPDVGDIVAQSVVEFFSFPEDRTMVERLLAE